VPGATRDCSCECGSGSASGSETCTGACAWGECTCDVECTAGAAEVETQYYGTCSTRYRTRTNVCSSECTVEEGPWGPWVGGCVPGSVHTYRGPCGCAYATAAAELPGPTPVPYCTGTYTRTCGPTCTFGPGRLTACYCDYPEDGSLPGAYCPTPR
jgi:hypothetical protein